MFFRLLRNNFLTTAPYWAVVFYYRKFGRKDGNMAGNVAGISTVGALTGYAIEESPGEKPSKYKLLHRVNSSDEISIETETIDASALEDKIERTIAGRGSTGGTFGVVVNLTDETIDEWEKLIKEYETAKTAGKAMWYEEYYPALKKAFFTKVEPPTIIPKPARDQNGLLTVTMTMTINEYIGPDTAIEPTDSEL